jgi:23S rRNA pseudouridine1911/1915/1917 synthase
MEDKLRTCLPCSTSKETSLPKFEITARDTGLRLDEFLASTLGGISRMRIARIVAGGACSINQRTAASGNRVAIGDVIEIDIFDQAPTAMTPEPLSLEIVYEDPDLVVLVKPAGMLVHPTRGVKTGTLANGLAYHLNQRSAAQSTYPDGIATVDEPSMVAAGVLRPGMVHRLDKATSGLMVIAKSRSALSVLSKHFRKRMVEKRYIALVESTIVEDAASMCAPIGRDPERRPQWSVSESGRPAETRLKVLERLPDPTPATLVELEPVTGRTNQLRIHCAHFGHPIIGDDLYCRRITELIDTGGPEPSSDPCAEARLAGDPSVDAESQASPAGGLQQGPGGGPGRLFLHAWRLSFRHPRTGQTLDFHSQLPSELASYLESLKVKQRHSRC